MNTLLFKLTVSAEPDLLQLHSVCLQVAKWGGLPIRKQLDFAHTITEKCDESLKVPKDIEFFWEQDTADRIAVIIKHSETVLNKEVLSLSAKPDLNRKPDIAGSAPVSQSGWNPTYQDLQQFNYSISHDLKNSLGKMKLVFSLLQEEPVPPTLRNYIDIIQRSYNKLESTMLSLEKIIHLGHAADEVVKTISPATVLQEVLEDFEEKLPGLQTDFEEVDTMQYIEVYLRSVYTNMLSNAVKYASPERTLEVSVSARKENDGIVLSFTDNGQGIDLEKHGAKLFQPFTRFTNKANGSGIGLFLVKTMIERNGGRVTVESHPERGTTFRFYLREYKPAAQ